MRRRILILAALLLLSASPIALCTILYLGHRLIVIRNAPRAEVMDALPFTDYLIPEAAENISIASRPARLWVYARFHIEEQQFVEWYESLGCVLTPITSPVTMKETFDFHYGNPKRIPTTVRRGVRWEGPAGLHETLVIIYDRDSGVGHVYGR